MPRPEVRWLPRYVIAQLVAQRGLFCATSLGLLDFRSYSGGLVDVSLVPNQRSVVVVRSAVGARPSLRRSVATLTLVATRTRQTRAACEFTMVLDQVTTSSRGGDPTCAASLARPPRSSRWPLPSRFSSSRPPASSTRNQDRRGPPVGNPERRATATRGAAMNHRSRTQQIFATAVLVTVADQLTKAVAGALRTGAILPVHNPDYSLG